MKRYLMAVIVLWTSSYINAGIAPVREPVDRSGQTGQIYEYRFLTAKRKGRLQKELDASVAEGFHPVAMLVKRDNNAALVLFALTGLRYDLIIRVERADCGHGDEPLRASEPGARLQITWRDARKDDKERIG